MAYKPGKYKARAVRGGMGESRNGTPQIGIEFAYEQDGVEQKIWWIGFLTEKALKHTLEKLAVVEFTGDDAFPEGAINTTKEVEIVIEEQVYEGKTQYKVAWINEVGGGKFAGLQPGAGKSGFDLRKEMKMVYAGRGVTAPTEKQEDIAF